MDEASRQTVALLNALIAVMQDLGNFGYDLFVKTRAYTVLAPVGQTFISDAGGKKHIAFGCSLIRDESHRRTITFLVEIHWTASQWLIKSWAESQDIPPNPIQTRLWSSPEYSATTIDEVIHFVQKAVRELIASAEDKRVAECLATIVPMHDWKQ
jgi:hypothetical protein